MNNDNIVLNRYPGVKPFSVNEEFLFFGRETDITTLITKISIYQSIVLYGKSGYGKSSLINAGILPKLKENDLWVCFSIRFNVYSKVEQEQNLSPTQTVKQRLSDKVVVNKDNILDNLIPNEDSFWYWIKQIQSQKEKVNFIIFFDQFEELFTYPIEQINEFSEYLSQLLYLTIPENFNEKIADFESMNLISNENHDFLYKKPDVKVIFSIRSDRMSLLNIITDKHPYILQNLYELDALNIEDAKKAIIEPAKLPMELGFDTPTFNFTEKAVKKILESILDSKDKEKDKKIEAATLQIVCRYVEETLVRENKHSEINENNLGDITDVFQKYYEGILSKLSETDKLVAQKLIEDELIDENQRNALSNSTIKKLYNNTITDELLKDLENSSLLRKERDASGRLLYEVSHDSLIEGINKVANNRRRIEEIEKNIFLEKQIDDERKRSEQLSISNRKVKFWIKVVTILATIFILITVYSVYSSLSIIEMKEELNDKDIKLKGKDNKLKEKEKELNRSIEKFKNKIEKANDSLKNVKEKIKNKEEELDISLFKVNFEKAKIKISNAKRLLKASDPNGASNEIKEAVKLLETKLFLPSELEENKEILKNRIIEVKEQINKKE